MGKQGPCYHCGITITPLWRNGPPDKPVLCNACGSRWRTKGTLMNYMPMHSGGFGADKARWSAKNSSRSVPDKATLSRKRKEFSDGNSESGHSKTSTYFSTSADEEASTRSSLGSEVSTFESPFYGSTVAPVRGTPWDTPVPSRRRTNMFRSRASSDKITRNVVSLEDQEVSSVTCPSTGDAVLFETKSPLVAVEIGLGSVFIRQPAHHHHQQQQEHESEASSLLIDSSFRVTQEHIEVPSRLGPAGLHNRQVLSSRGKEELGSLQRPESPFNLDLKTFAYNKENVLQSAKSPLTSLELKDIVNADTFSELMTEQEQLQLLKLLSSVDVSHCPESLASMFNSSEFEAALSNFQRLLSGGVFESSDTETNSRMLQHYQQLLCLTDLNTSGWKAGLSQFQTRTAKRRAEALSNKEQKLLKAPVSNFETKSVQSSLVAEGTTRVMPEVSASTLKIETSFQSKKNESTMTKKPVKNIMEEGHDSGGEQDLLVTVPSSMSFRQDAELISLEDESRGKNCEAGDLIVTNTWHATDWDALLWNPASTMSSRRRVLPNGTVLNP